MGWCVCGVLLDAHWGQEGETGACSLVGGIQSDSRWAKERQWQAEGRKALEHRSWLDKRCL